MLNGLGEIQSVAVLGAKSDLAVSILKDLPLSRDAEIILYGRNLQSFSLPDKLKVFRNTMIEVDFQDIEAARKEISSLFSRGDIDLVVIAYAILGNEDHQLDADLFASVLHVNLYSQAILLNDVYSRMAIQKHGQILLISSVAGMRPRRRNFVYGVSKASVDFLAQGFQKLTSDSNVFLTILRPGFVFTKMTGGMKPAPFATSQGKVSQIAVKGLKRKKKVVYAPRKLIMVMFLIRLLPERLFRLLDK
jgi:decaprenylphospho-beta-D-erythro-pentofuranosid-2-ulose 2-reductase